MCVLAIYAEKKSKLHGSESRSSLNTEDFKKPRKVLLYCINSFVPTWMRGGECWCTETMFVMNAQNN